MKSGMWIGLALLALPIALWADVEATEELGYDVDAGARVSLENINGDIRVNAGEDGRVEIVAHKQAGSSEYLEKLEVVVHAEPDYVRIETRHPNDKSGWFNWGGDSSGSVSYELTVPRDAELDSIETVNGDVSIRAVGGTVKASTVNGGIDVENLAANVGLETVNGSINADFDSLGAGQRVEAETVNGKITLYLPGTASARITAETVNGGIDADDFGLEPEKGFVGRDLDGKIGDGDARISLDTVNGAIRLKKK